MNGHRMVSTQAGDAYRATSFGIGPDDGLSAFMSARSRLFGIAFRMLGSAAEAEDVVQDVWVRWQTTDRSRVVNPSAFLVTTTTRLAINVLQSARARRETCASTWLPELVDAAADPGRGAARGEALRFAVLLLLERLSPTERAAYVLREAFDRPYREIAEALRVEEANARQLVSRARDHVSCRRRVPVEPEEQQRFLDAFVGAAETGDLEELESLFVAGTTVATTRHKPGRCPVMTSVRPTSSNRIDTQRSIDHETRHRRRHRAHRIEARDQAA